MNLRGEEMAWSSVQKYRMKKVNLCILQESDGPHAQLNIAIASSSGINNVVVKVNQ